MGERTIIFCVCVCRWKYIPFRISHECSTFFCRSFDFGPFIPKIYTSIYLFLMPRNGFRNVHARARVQIVCLVVYGGSVCFFQFVSSSSSSHTTQNVRCVSRFGYEQSNSMNRVNGFENPSLDSVRSLVCFG